MTEGNVEDMGIVEFLRQRLDEDEAEARDAIVMRKNTYAHQPWVDDDDLTFKAWDDHPTGVVIVGPERVLREVAAKRRVVTEHFDLDNDPEPFCWNCDGDRWPCKTLAALASVYADHEDYDPAWALDTSDTQAGG